MSVVTNVIVSGFAGCETDGNCSVIWALNAYLRQPFPDDHEIGDMGQLVQVDQHAGGRKAIESNVWMGAFNYLNVEEFITIFREACKKLRCHTDPQLLIKRQDDDKFHDIPCRQ